MQRALPNPRPPRQEGRGLQLLRGLKMSKRHVHLGLVIQGLHNGL